MKLLVCDDREIKYFSMPSKVLGTFTINFDLYVDNSFYSETLNILASNGKWVVSKENRLNINYNGSARPFVELQENMSFDIRFVDMVKSVTVYAVADFVDCLKYSILGLQEIKIGSASDCNVRILDTNNLSVLIKSDGNNFYVSRCDSVVSSSYLNSFVYSNEKLRAGDVIFIKGIKIIFMKSFVLIDPFDRKISISGFSSVDGTSNEVPPTITPVNDLEKKVKLYTDSQLFVHTPHLKQEVEEVVVEFDEPPTKEHYEKVPVIFTVGSSAILTLTSGITLINTIRSFINGQSDAFSLILEFVIFGVMLLTGLFLPMLMDAWQKSNANKREKIRKKKYTKYVKEQELAIEQIIIKQTNILQNNNLSLEKIVTNINNNCKDVWSREIFDNDFLTINLGYGNIPAKIKIEAPKKGFTLDDDELLNLVLETSNKKYLLQNVPIAYSLLNNRITPIVIDGKNSSDYIKSIMLQLLYFYSGNDLKIVTITSAENEKNWEFMKYCPHSWNDNYDFRFFASNEEEVAQLSLYLEQEYDNRKKNGKDKKYLDFQTYYLIVTDNYSLARELSLVNKIFEEDNYGFSFLIFENSIKNIPSKFETLIQIFENKGVILEKNIKEEEQIVFATSYINDLDINSLAKVIANIPVNIRKSEYGIPSNVTFLELFNVGRIEQLNVLSRWKSNNPTISLKTPIGVKENNKLVELDLHEKYHGPHGLIAGSTGPGPSEFIITYILSLAVNDHPYEVQFVLIDYKGGGLALAFENRETKVKIPHLVGTITNLDKSEMYRTLTSIKSELQRRQRVFNYAREKNDESTIDIYKYQRLYREGKVDEPMSHLFIISDEFAELKASQPDFMDELVSAARIGRSLGVHLILATQKPSGVVNEQIWSNTRFRVCLKVQTTEDSNELLKRNDAAFLTDAGRFYLQVGNDELFELGQSGYAGAKYSPADVISRKVEDDLLVLSNNGNVLKVINEDVKREEKENFGDQITNIVKYLYDLAVSENIHFSSLWKENIPSEIYYEPLIKKYNLKPRPFIIEPIIGEYDDPENQNQGYVSLPLSYCGNTFIVGNSGSGKSTLLSTIIFSTIVNHNCDEVNIYIIDLGLEKLKEFQNAPQVGEVLTSNDPDKIKFLFYMLQDEKNRRFAYYSTHGGSFDNDILNGKAPFPTILVFINQFETFKEAFEEIVDSDMGSLTRNCAKAGIIFILTSSLTNALGYNLENNFPKKIMLNMLDSTDYSLYFNTNIIPKKNPGRGIIAINDVPYEFQVSLLFKDAYENNLNYVLSKLCLYIKKRAKKVPVIPEEVTFELLEDKINSLSNVPLGVNVETAQVNYYDFNGLLNIISSENHITAKMFFPVLTHILSKINNTKVIVINSINDLKLNYLSDVKYYDTGFEDVIKTIYNNVIKYQTNPKDTNFVIIFLGYAGLENHLVNKKHDDESVISIDELILSSKALNNFKYVIYDNEEGIKKIEDSNLDNYFKRNKGLWLGKNFDSQSTFEVEIRYDSKSYGNGTVTAVNNQNVSHIKFL